VKGLVFAEQAREELGSGLPLDPLASVSRRTFPASPKRGALTPKKKTKATLWIADWPPPDKNPSIAWPMTIATPDARAALANMKQEPKRDDHLVHAVEQVVEDPPGRPFLPAAGEIVLAGVEFELLVREHRLVMVYLATMIGKVKHQTRY